MAVSAVKSEPAPAEAAPHGGGKKGLIKIVVMAVVVLGLGGGGAWWYLGHKGGEEHKEAKPEPVKPPVFYALETFTVNLVQIDAPQFLQTGITLKVADEKVVEELKQRTPIVRDRILMLMSSRKAVELLTVEGKRELGEQIVASMNEILGYKPPKAKPAKAAAKSEEAKAAEAQPAEEEEDPEEAKDSKAEKSTAAKKGGAEKSAEPPVQTVLFTTFIIQ